MINIQLQDGIQGQLEQASIGTSQLKAAAEATLQYAGKQGDVTLVLTGDEQLRALNRQYRGIDAPTDVLSFELGDTDPDTGEVYLGDVILSFQRAVVQAQAEGHPVIAEARLLVVHGVLHLLGYDHANEAEQAAMWAAQSEILAALAA